MAEQTATNPQTGEKVVFRNGAWVPMEPVVTVPTQPQPSQQRASGDVVMENATRTLLNNVMATPSATGDLLAGGAALAQTGAESLFTNPKQGFVERLGNNFEAQQGQFPANALRAIPRPTVTDITSAARSIPALMPGGETPQDAFARNKQESLEAQALQAEQFPGQTMVGETLGDAASLALGRQPFAKNLVERSKSIPQISNPKVREAMQTISQEQPELAADIVQLTTSGRLRDPGAVRLFNRVVDSKATRSVMRGLGKAGEASIEGAVMAAVKENDPLLNAGLAGGAQMGASLAALIGAPSSIKGLAVRAGGMFALFRTLQEFGPGDNDIFSAADSSFNKIALGLTVGVSAKVLGGRLRGSGGMGERLAEDLPRLTDAINTIPRGAVLSLLNQAQTEQANGENLTELTLQTLSTNPGAFPDAIRNRLSRAMDNNKLAEEIRKMRDLSDFTDVLDARSQR